MHSARDIAEDPALPLLPVTPAERKHSKVERDAVYRKISWRLLPLSFLITLVCYVDRTNISLAAIDMSDDLNLSKTAFGAASSMFFITYTIFQIPSNAVLIKMGGPVWLGILLIGWGITASLTAFVQNATQLYVMRLVLGIFEAGTFPGLTYYLALFFPDSRLAKAMAITMAGSIVGMALSSPLGGAFLSMDGLWKLHGWQWLFLLEGLPAVLLGIVSMLYLPKSPSSMGFLHAREQAILIEDECAVQYKVPMLQQVQYLFKSVVLSWEIWLLIVIELLNGIMKYALLFWTPIWIDVVVNGGGLDWTKGSKSSTKSDDVSGSKGVEAALLSAIPYGVASVAVVLAGWSSEKLNDRKLHCMFLWVIGGGVFMALPWLLEINKVLGFVALITGHVGAVGKAGPWTSFVISFMTDENKNFGLAWLNTFGNASGLFGPMLTGVLADQTGSYKSAIWVFGALLVLDGILIVFLKDSVRVQKGKSKELEAGNG